MCHEFLCISLFLMHSIFGKRALLIQERIFNNARPLLVQSMPLHTYFETEMNRLLTWMFLERHQFFKFYTSSVTFFKYFIDSNMPFGASSVCLICKHYCFIKDMAAIRILTRQKWCCSVPSTVSVHGRHCNISCEHACTPSSISEFSIFVFLCLKGPFILIPDVIMKYGQNVFNFFYFQENG